MISGGGPWQVLQKFTDVRSSPSYVWPCHDVIVTPYSPLPPTRVLPFISTFISDYAHTVGYLLCTYCPLSPTRILLSSATGILSALSYPHATDYARPLSPTRIRYLLRAYYCHLLQAYCPAYCRLLFHTRVLSAICYALSSTERAYAATSHVPPSLSNTFTVLTLCEPRTLVANPLSLLCICYAMSGTDLKVTSPSGLRVVRY